jgi:fibronectin-binding autotransporter adhesin
MSILNVNQIQPVGSGQTVTISATNVDAGSATVTAGTFTGNLTGNVTGSVTVGDKFLSSAGFGLGSTTTAGRNAGVGTASGTLIFNSSTGSVQVYTGTTWQEIKNSGNLEATGGTIDSSTRPGFNVHTFTGDDTFTVTTGSGNIEVLVVAGGGGGAGPVGGGGGAGGYRSISSIPVSVGNYTIQVGGGGAGGPSASPAVPGSKGTPSYITNPGISSVTATGGGFGANAGNTGGTGGSGGGGSGVYGAGLGGPGPGNEGGADPRSSPTAEGYAAGGGQFKPEPYGYWTMGGGGGASAVGSDGNPVTPPNAPNTGATATGQGGAGQPNSITGSSVVYAGGGSGGSAPESGGKPSASPAGGPGGGGRGGSAPPLGVTATSGSPATGGGGGGAGSGHAGGNGGDGVVIIAYPTA